MPLKPKVPSEAPPASLRKPTRALQHILETYATVLELRREVGALHGRIDAIELAYLGLSRQVKELGVDQRAEEESRRLADQNRPTGLFIHVVPRPGGSWRPRKPLSLPLDRHLQALWAVRQLAD